MKKKILIIEDEQTLVKALTEGIDGSYKMYAANDGEAGLEMIEQVKPDLIILDLILPKMDGFEILRRIKQDAATKDIPVMVLTNLSDVNDKVVEMGAGECLVKSDSTVEDIKRQIVKSIG